jgi:tRNA pseudouridine38-40 synthase
VRHFKLTLAYDGTGLVGWQRQASGTSVQGLLEDACARLANAPVAVAGAGRTDAGVHAAGQVASASFDTALDAATLRRALNAHLPPAVRVWRIEETAPGFHARFARHRKTYEYRILNGPVADPFRDRYAWHVPQRLSPAAMSDAAASLAGTHDFAAFQSAGSDVATTVRTIESSTLTVHSISDDVEEGGAAGAWDGSWLVYRIVGTGFLRHMVRTVAGTLVEIGAGRADPEIITALLATRARAGAGPTAPAHGLCLRRVEYF